MVEQPNWGHGNCISLEGLSISTNPHTRRVLSKLAYERTIMFFVEKGELPESALELINPIFAQPDQEDDVYYYDPDTEFGGWRE